MCLAKAFLYAADGDSDAQPLMENVVRIVVRGDRVRLTSLLGDVEELPARVASIDFVQGRLALERTDSP